MTGEVWHCILSFMVLFVVYLVAVVLALKVHRGVDTVSVGSAAERFSTLNASDAESLEIVQGILQIVERKIAVQRQFSDLKHAANVDTLRE